MHVRELVERPLHDLDAVASAQPVDHPGAATDGELLGALGGDGAREVDLHQAGPGPGRGVDDGGPGLGDRAGQGVDGPLDQPVGDVGGVGVAGQHGVDDLVDGAGAARVVGGVEHDLAPRPVEERLGPPAGWEEEGGEGLGQALERALGAGRGLLHVDPVGGHAHQQVGPGPRAQLAPPVREAVDGCRRHVVGQPGDHQPVVVLGGVGLGDEAGELRLRHQVVGAVHPEDRPDEHLAVGVLEPADHLDQLEARVGERGPVAVALREVLGPHGRAVGRLPPEPGPVDRRGHAPPHHGVGEARPGAGSGASGRRGRTCRAGTRPPSPRRSRPPGAGPSGGRGRWSRPTPGTRP